VTLFMSEVPPLAFRRERTVAVAILALLAPIPLAFTNALDGGALGLYLSVGALSLN